MKVFFIVYIGFLLVACGYEKAANPRPILPESVQTEAAISEDLTKKLQTSLLTNDHSFQAHEELDLHGKRLKSSEKLITEFLEKSQKEGSRYVLIITGKGKHSKVKETLSDGTEVGRIKFQFLSWLQSHYFNNYIDDFSYALPKDGGEGAFYIRLKPTT